MIDRLFVLIVLCVGIKTAFADNTVSQHLSRTQKLQQIVNEDCLKYQLPALSISIQSLPAVKPETYVCGHYSLENRAPITDKTLFQIGSITKTFTATIVFQYVAQQKIGLEDNLAQWLPQYAKWHHITIKNLLTHTSGIENYTHGKKFDNLLKRNPKKIYSPTQLIQIAYDAPLLAQPGKIYHYSNTDYILLGMILEKVSHKTLQKLFDQYFQQYHLHHTFYAPMRFSRGLLPQIAHGYNRDETFDYNQDVTRFNLSFTQSAGAILSTPNDIVLWLNQLFSAKIVVPATFKQMTAVFLIETLKPINLDQITLSDADKQKSYLEIGAAAGMGLIYLKNGGLVWVHAGGTLGYEAFYAYNPQSQTYLAIAYSVKPKQQRIFLNIANDIFENIHS